jgi:hypothetical protein
MNSKVHRVRAQTLGTPCHEDVRSEEERRSVGSGS